LMSSLASVSRNPIHATSKFWKTVWIDLISVSDLCTI